VRSCVLGMRDRQTCIDCGKQSPETETNYTLISAQFGWRLTRRKTESGDFVVEWRCPDCWRKHKQKQLEDVPSSGSPERMTPRTPAPRSSRPPPPSSARPSKAPAAAPGVPRKRP
jgi:hypothetical protein